MTTIYIVEVGEYSDRRIVSAHSNTDEADAIARRYCGSVQELELDEPLGAEEQRMLRPGERAYRVFMQADGSQSSTEVIWQEPEGGASYGLHNDRFIAECFASSPEHAIKIANERRSAWIAYGKTTSPLRNDPHGAGRYGWVEAIYNGGA